MKFKYSNSSALDSAENVFKYRHSLLSIHIKYSLEAFYDIYFFNIPTLAHNTYLLTPWSRVFLEKPTGLQLVKKFLAFYETRRFITALTSARHLSLS
jgi:hypothetical protein